jgi:hypothetical protein
MAVVIATAMALRDAGAQHGIWAFAVMISWFVGPFLAVHVVSAFHPHELGSRIARTVLAILIVIGLWIGIFLWNGFLAPLVGLDCVSVESCPAWQVVLSVLGQAVVVFVAAYAGAALASRFKGSHRPRGSRGSA